MNQRNIAFDVIKGIAIIAVVLYHFGMCQNGYLGVDVFLVIAGFFTAKSLYKQDVKTVMGGGKYLIDRVIRLLPLLLVAEVAILAYGFLLMMPDDFENVSQSVIASNFFANNVLADITTKNYWDAVNEYKPLMHTWYLGILMQFYVFFVIVDLLVGKIWGKQKKPYIIVWALLTMVSLGLYLADFPKSSKFYQLPFRIFEFGVGSLAFYLPVSNSPVFKKSARYVIILSYLIVLLLLFANSECVSGGVGLLSTVICSFFLVYLLPKSDFSANKFMFNKPLAIIGAASFSIFVWHQIVFALTRYSITADFNSLPTVVIMLAIIGLLSYLSYRYIEKIKFTKLKIAVVAAMFVIINACAFVVYIRAGIFYDIPELEVKADNIRRGMWAEYCDRGYEYDKDFQNGEKPRWLIIGNSFGRDFINVILESDIRDKVDIAYAVNFKDPKYQRRLQEADLVFLSTSGITEEMVSELKQTLAGRQGRLIVVGEKNFGVNNGQVFRKRNDKDYLKATIAMEDKFEERNNRFKSLYEGYYIDLISIAKSSDGKVRVFSDDGRFISQDCRHLTKAGAQFYASKINWADYIR